MRSSTKWILSTAAAAIVTGSQAVSFAQDAQRDPSPSTQPTTKPDRRERGWDGRDFGSMRDRQGGFMQGRAPDYRNEESPTDEEWADMVEFMKVNSPVRLEMYDKLADTLKSSNARPVTGARRRIAARYRDLMAMKEHHQDMYEFALRQTVLEDQILGSMRDIRLQGESDALRAKLHDQVAAYVDNFLNEREARLKRLREMVEKETQTIQEDRASIDKLVDKQSQRFEKEMSRLLDFWEDPEKFAPQAPSNP